MLKIFFKEYLNFSKKERSGALVLLFLIAFLIVLPLFYPFLIKQKQYDHQQFEKEIAKLRLKQEDSTGSFVTQNFNEGNYHKQAEKKLFTPQKGELFYFDPNTLPEPGWQKLGVKDKAIETIQKYLSKGGKFYKPEDIGKIWGLHAEEIKRLIPYIKIEQDFKNTWN